MSSESHTFQITITYVKPRGWFGWKQSSPSFPVLDGWTFHAGGKATPEGHKEVSYRGEGSVPLVMETLFSYLTAAVKKGEIEAGFDVKLFEQH